VWIGFGEGACQNAEQESLDHFAHIEPDCCQDLVQGLEFRFYGLWLMISDLMFRVNRIRRGLVFKAHRLVYHSTLGLGVMKKKKKANRIAASAKSTMILLFFF